MGVYLPYMDPVKLLLRIGADRAGPDVAGYPRLDCMVFGTERMCQLYCSKNYQ